MGFSKTRPDGTARVGCLTAEIVKTMVRDFTGSNKHDLATRFGVSWSAVHSILMGRTWSGSTMEERRAMRANGIVP